jgi:hypothetical protein
MKWLVTETMDQEGNRHSTQEEIIRVFHAELQERFNPIKVIAGSAEEVYSMITQKVEEEMGDVLDATITNSELEAAILQAPVKKSPGADGITAELYKWGKEMCRVTCYKCTTIFLQTGQLPRKQKQGIIVCIPKHNTPERVADYRPLTLLNADYKIYTRILANRMKQTLHVVLNASQYSGVKGRNIIDVAAGLRHFSGRHQDATGNILNGFGFHACI